MAKTKIRATYTVNNGEDQTGIFHVDAPDGLERTVEAYFALSDLIADQLLDQGQIMIAGLEVLDTVEQAETEDA